MSAIPAIDLAQPSAVVANAIGQACVETGFFTVINHGVPASLIAKVYAVARGLLRSADGGEDESRASAA